MPRLGCKGDSGEEREVGVASPGHQEEGAPDLMGCQGEVMDITRTLGR